MDALYIYIYIYSHIYIIIYIILANPTLLPWEIRLLDCIAHFIACDNSLQLQATDEVPKENCRVLLNLVLRRRLHVKKAMFKGEVEALLHLIRTPSCLICSVGHNHTNIRCIYVGLARTIFIWCIYGTSGR
jgi:hypothetical protein